MPIPRKLNVFIGIPSYGGNGGISSEYPAVRTWFTNTVMKAKQDERINDIFEKTVGDTPITMVRNRFVTAARAHDADVLVMIDSDMDPQFHQHEAWFKPFFETSFDFLYDHWEKGPVVIGAPYGGPPENHENIYCFLWRTNRNVDGAPSLEQYTREEAFYMRGIQECAALPTGLIMYDMRCFDLIDPPYFDYEYTNEFQEQKASTEDVQNTRDISIAGTMELGYNPVFCNWDSWAAHLKPWPVGKPYVASVDEVGARLQASALRGRKRFEEDVQLRPKGDWLHRVKASGNGRSNGHVSPAPPKDYSEHEFLRTINGHADIKGYGHKTTDEHLASLIALVANFEQTRGRKPKVLEIGTWCGESAVALSDAESVVCIDLWEQTDATKDSIGNFDASHAYDVCQENLSRFPHIHIVRGNSQDDLLDENVVYDIIFIDAGHDFESVRADIKKYLPFLADDGMMVGHDYKTVQFPGVDAAVRFVFGPPAAGQIQTYGKTQHGGFWLHNRVPEVEQCQQQKTHSQ